VFIMLQISTFSVAVEMCVLTRYCLATSRLFHIIVIVYLIL